MRIVTKLLASLAIITMIAAASISIIIIQNPFSDNPPLINTDNSLSSTIDKSQDEDEQEEDDNEDINDIRFFGTWEQTNDDQTNTEIIVDMVYSDSELNYRLDGTDLYNSEVLNVKAAAPTSGQNSTNSSNSSEDDVSNPPDKKITIMEGDYDIDTKNKTIRLIDNKTSITYKYNFSNDDNTLTLTDLSTNENYIYHRKIYNVNSSNDLKNHYYHKVNITGTIPSENFSKWLNLTLIDQSTVPINLTDISFNFNSHQGKTVNFNANVIPYSSNQTWSLPDNNCSCYLSNIESDSVIIKDN